MKVQNDPAVKESDEHDQRSGQAHDVIFLSLSEFILLTCELDEELSVRIGT